MGKGDEDGSYQKLIKDLYGANKANISLTRNYKEFNTEIILGEFALQSSFQFVRSGYYIYNSGELNGRYANGNFWEANVYSFNNANRLRFSSTVLHLQNNYGKIYGFSVRCVAK